MPNQNVLPDWAQNLQANVSKDPYFVFRQASEQQRNAAMAGLTNNFQAQQANLPQQDYAAAIQAAQQQALGGGAAQGQDRLAAALEAQANGQGPSLAQLQLQEATQANAAQAAGAVASQRGLNPALAQRLIANQQANQNQMAAGQSGLLRMQEQLGAREQLAQALAAQRGQQIQLYGAAGQLGQGQNAQSLQNLAQSQALNQQTAAQNQSTGLGIMQTQAGIGAQADRDRAETNKAIIGGTLAGIGTVAAAAIAHGGEIGGAAPVAGDSLRNDTVPAVLSPGEIVLPRSVTQSDDAAEKAKAFVEAIKAKKQSGPDSGYGRVLAKTRELHDRLSRLEAMYCGGMVGGA